MYYLYEAARITRNAFHGDRKENGNSDSLWLVVGRNLVISCCKLANYPYYASREMHLYPPDYGNTSVD